MVKKILFCVCPLKLEELKTTDMNASIFLKRNTLMVELLEILKECLDFYGRMSIEGRQKISNYSSIEVEIALSLMSFLQHKLSQ